MLALDLQCFIAIGVSDLITKWHCTKYGVGEGSTLRQAMVSALFTFSLGILFAANLEGIGGSHAHCMHVY